jgi:hypothetical protein
MKKAFDANVSRARPKLRLGAMMGTVEGASVSQETVESLAQAIAQEPVIPSRVPASELNLADALKARQSARVVKPSAVEVLASALQADESMETAPRAEASVAPVQEPVAFQAPVARGAPSFEDLSTAQVVAAPPHRTTAAAKSAPVSPRAAVEAPVETREVQTAPSEAPLPDSADRREKLRERLKAVRENPRPEPLPETVAEAGVLAVERIATLQSELAKTRAMNLALSQDLEAARRQAERATEEARLRMDEARRLSKEMEGRVTLLSDLEKELAALEGERNEALLALQESRQAIEAQEREKLELRESVLTKDKELEASLQEEERLASELESAHEAMVGLRRTADALKGERDTLARQVADLTKERAELLEARKALEAVHRALAKASALA